MARMIAADRGCTVSESGQPCILFDILTVDPVMPGGMDITEIRVLVTGDETPQVLKSKITTEMEANLVRLNTLFNLSMTMAPTGMVLPTYQKG